MDQITSFGYPVNAMDHASIRSLDDLPPCPSPIPPVVEFSYPSQTGIQTPTPMLSHSPSPPMAEENNPNEGNIVVSVSTAFHPGAHGVDPDTIFASSDMVLFYVHSQILNSSSPHAFRRVFEEQRAINKNVQVATHCEPQSPANYLEGIVNVPETSAVLNVILHTLYGTSSAQHSPSIETLITAVDRMPYHDLNPKDYITPRTPLYDLLLTYAPLYPLQLYTLAGYHDLRDLAVAISPHLLSYPLANLPEEMAERMGALYLKRLLCLHLDRFNSLKRILLQPPHPHPSTKECSFTDQKKLTRAWALVSAYLAWDARPDLSTHSMQNALNPLTEHLNCVLCHEALQKRIKDVVVQWASVKRTI